MKIRILSDLHIEHHMPSEVPTCDADLVVLAGDIANGRDGLDWAVRQFDAPIVYVPGNHEYYENAFEVIDPLLAEAANAYPDVHLLNGATAVFSDAGGTAVRVIGATWWTDYDLFGKDRHEAAMEACIGVILDHRLIETIAPGGRQRFMPTDALARHQAATRWLAAQLAEPFDGKTVVVTHHAPDLGSLDPRYSHDLVSAGFVSRRPDLVIQADLWIHGHTHTSFDYWIDDARVVCNPRGYISRRSGAPENAVFDWGKVVEL